MRKEPYLIGTILILWGGTFNLSDRFMIVERITEYDDYRDYYGQGWGVAEENLISLKEFEDKLDEFMRKTEDIL